MAHYSRILTNSNSLKKFSKRISEENDCLNKGYEFEKFVVSKFNPDFFTLLEWRSDKTSGGIHPVSNCYPDLIYKFSLKGQSKYFAVECKFKTNLCNDSLWVEQYKIENYLRFQDKYRMKVFIVFGIGGHPHHPNELCIVPLESLNNSNKLYKNELYHYRKNNPQEYFYFDYENLLLQ